VSDWLIWQLVDSAFPTGGFAHSGGLEAAREHGEISHREQLIGYCASSLRQAGHAGLPLVAAAHIEPKRLRDFDQLCDAFTTNHVANRASRIQGQALLAAALRIFPNLSQIPHVDTHHDGVPLRAWLGENAPGHFAPMWGAVTSALGFDLATAQRLFLFLHLRTLIAAAIRLNVVGPMQGQALQHQLTPDLEEVWRRCSELRLEDLAQTAPLQELWQGSHDRLDARLFQS